MRTALARRTPILADQINASGAAALRDSVGTPKRAGSAGGVSDRLAREWFMGAPGSPVSRFLQLLASILITGGDPWPLVTITEQTALQGLLSMNDAELVRRFWTLMGEESRCEGEENSHSAMFARTGDLLGFADAHERELTIAKQLAAVARELHARGVDPRTFGRD